MPEKRKYSYLEIRHDAIGLLEISNQYTMAFDTERFTRTVAILQGQHNDACAARIPADNVIFLDIPSLRGLNLKAVFRLFSLCKQYRVSHLLAHRYKPAFIAGLVALLYKPNAVFAVLHGNRQFDRPGRKLAARLIFWTSNFKLIGVSQTTRADITRRLPGKSPKDIIAIPNCIDVAKTQEQLLDRQDAQKQLNIQNDRFVFGHIGRLSPAKDQLTLLRGFKAAKNQMPDSTLIIVGGGRLETTLKDEAKRLQIDTDVIFTGPINNAWRLMKGFDCFVATSVTEGFGLVIVESMVAKIPLIATDIGSFNEIAGQAVDLVPCGDHIQVGNRMVELYNMPKSDRVALGNLLFQRVQQEFSVPRFRQRIQKLYNSTL